MNKEKKLKLVVSITVALILLHYVILPGLSYPNTVTQLLSLFGFFFLLSWIFGWVKVSLEKEQEKNAADK